jgi:hypothetical protein
MTFLATALVGMALLAVAEPAAARPVPDSDRDGLSDRYERGRSGTSPRRADTDRDGLRDRFELKRSRTNPRKRDTDSDGLSDGAEIRLGSNPRRRPGGPGKHRFDPIQPPSEPLPTRPPAPAPPPSPPSPSPSPPHPPPPPPDGFPTPATTGVPDGWRPTQTTNGSLTVTQEGAVISGRLVTGGINVRARNVTIRNSRVYGAIYNQANNRVYSGLVVEDTEIGPDQGNNGATTGSLGAGGYVARRVHIHNSTEGFRVGGYSYSGGEAGPVVIEDSFVDLDSRAGSCDHADGVQEYDGPPSLVVSHNTIDMRGVDCSTGPIYLGDSPGVKSVTNNLIMGGSYPLRLHNEAPGITYSQVSGNRIVNHAWDWGPLLVDSCSVVSSWSDNHLVTIDAGYRVTELGTFLTRC